MDKINITTNTFVPMPVVLVGTQISGRANFMAVGWCSRANFSPPMIVCAIGNHHYTVKGIAETKSFSVNIPSNHYWKMGECAGDAWSAGKRLKKLEGDDN